MPSRAELGWRAWVSRGAPLGGLWGEPAVQPAQASSAALVPEGKGQVGAVAALKWHLWMQGSEENGAVGASVFTVQACAPGISKKKTGRRSLLQEDCSKKLISISVLKRRLRFGRQRGCPYPGGAHPGDAKFNLSCYTGSQAKHFWDT